MRFILNVRYMLVCWLLLAAFCLPAHADEFIGPLAGWANLKTTYGAVGNGTANDTTALQNALNDLGTAGHSNTLYIPAGTYCISSTLTMASKSGIAIYGENPANTTIKWIGGASGGAMMSANGVWYSRYGRITWDGMGQVQTAWYDYWQGTSNYFPTRNEHADTVFKNVAYGLRAGQQGTGFGPNTGDAETAVLRCKFLNCSTAGFSVQDFNALDWFFWNCTFDNCAKGVSNSASSNGAGNFHVYNSVFRNSTVADVAVANTNFFSCRGNYSSGSNQFFVASWLGNGSSQITLQKNTVLDCQNTAVKVENAGPLMLIDNVFRGLNGQTAAQISVGVGNNQEDTLSVGNKYTVTNPISAGGRVRTMQDQVVSRASITASEPAMPGALPNNNRNITELGPTATGANIQTAINNAVANYGGQRPVVHIQKGDHSVANTIEIPAGADVQLVGDGFAGINGTTLRWTGAAGGTVLTLKASSRATVRDLQVISTGTSGVADTGIKVLVTDTAGDRVYMEQGDVDGNTQAGLLVNGLDKTVVELHDFYHGGSAGNSVSVVGGGGTVSGRVNLFGGLGTNNAVSYNVSNNGRLMVQDVWYEAHPSGPSFLNLSGSGTFTLQGGHVAAVTNTTTPVINVGNFTGTASLIGLRIGANYSSQPSKMTIQNTAGAGAKVMALGIIGDNDNWFVNNSSGAQVGFTQNKANDSSGSKQLANLGLQTDAFLQQGLAQTRAEYAGSSIPAAVAANRTDARFYRVRSHSGDGATAFSPVNIRIEKTPAGPATPGTKYEAESGYKENGAVNYDDAAASGAKGVKGTQNPGAADTIGSIDGGTGGQYVLSIRYANSNMTPAIKHVFINGVEIGQLSFPYTGSGSGYTYGFIAVPVTLNSGATNSLSIQNFGSDVGEVMLDYFQFSPLVGTIYEAENGFKENGAVNYDDTAASGAKGVQGFQNSGAADTIGSIDGGMGGKYILTIRYLNTGSPSNKHVFINGVELPNSVTFQTKPGYELQCFVVTLNSGATNSLSFQNFSDTGAVKIDSFQFSLQ